MTLLSKKKKINNYLKKSDFQFQNSQKTGVCHFISNKSVFG